MGTLYNLGVCISQPPALCLAPGPGPRPQFVFTSPDSQFVLSALAPNLYLTVLAPNLYLPTLAPNLYLPALALNFYTPALVSPRPGLHVPTLTPQFVFTGHGQRFLLPCCEFAFTLLSIVVALAAVILAIVVIYLD